MEKIIVLLQFRQDNSVAAHEKRCISRIVGASGKLLSKNVFRGESIPSVKDIPEISRIIIGGSGEFSFSEKEKTPKFWAKVKETVPFIKKAIKENIPILGICLGHQYLAYILGSEIVKDKKQEEVGAFYVSLTAEGESDPLFSKMPPRFLAQEGHGDSLKKIPKGAILLAKGEKCKIQALRFNNLWGVQFHPELSSISDVKFRIKLYPNYVVKGKNRIKSTPLARKIIKNFLYL